MLRNELQYYLPNWEDRLDPNYDFETDTFSRDKSSAYATDVYAHQIFKKPPYDGILISLAIFKDKINLMPDGTGGKQIRQFKSIKESLAKILKSSKNCYLCLTDILSTGKHTKITVLLNGTIYTTP